MYPETLTELTGLIGVLVPLVIATFAGLLGVHTKAGEIELVKWRRINELAAVLYNKDNDFGLWAQIAAAHELGESSRSHRRAARAILQHARIHFAGNITLGEALAEALSRANRTW